MRGGAAYHIAVDHAVLVQADERAEALPSDLLHALHLRERATVSRVGRGGQEGRGGRVAGLGSRHGAEARAQQLRMQLGVMGRTVKYLGSRHSSMYL